MMLPPEATQAIDTILTGVSRLLAKKYATKFDVRLANGMLCTIAPLLTTDEQWQQWRNHAATLLFRSGRFAKGDEETTP